MLEERGYTSGMLTARLTQAIVRTLDWIARHALPPEKKAAHLHVGIRGEEEAYFYLRKSGYVMVARNFRSPRCRGEIDLIGWDGDVLCFIHSCFRRRWWGFFR